jgi:hypothetical protein
MNSIVILYLDSTLSSMWRLTPQLSGRAALSSAPHVHNVMAHMRRARVAV